MLVEFTPSSSIWLCPEIQSLPSAITLCVAINFCSTNMQKDYQQPEQTANPGLLKLYTVPKMLIGMRYTRASGRATWGRTMVLCNGAKYEQAGNKILMGCRVCLLISSHCSFMLTNTQNAWQPSCSNHLEFPLMPCLMHTNGNKDPPCGI